MPVNGPARLALLLALQALSLAKAQSPVQKVLQMLTDMKTKGLQEKEVESMTFASYAKFVRLRTAELERETASATAQAEELAAAIAKHESDVQALNGQINELGSQVATMEADQKAAAQLRESEHSEFLQQQTSYTESLYALDRAIQLLKAQSYDRAQADALLQRTAKTVPGMRRVLAALELLQTGTGSSALDWQPSGAPAVAAYEFQSGSIVETLEQLREKFRDELGQLQKEEMNMAHAFSMQDLHAGNTIANLKAEAKALTESKTRIAAEAAATKDELIDTKAGLATAQESLAEMTATFSTKKAMFEANQKVRADEIEAITKAVQMLSAPEIAGAYEAHVQPTFAALPAPAAASLKPPTFLQLRSSEGRGERCGRAAELLRGRSRELRSRVLASVAEQVAVNPFTKVIDMIKSLLERLKEEAASEADHKAFCDEELRTNKLKREKMGSRAARLHAEIEDKTMDIAKKATDIAALAQEQTELRKAMADATAVRIKEKEENLAAITDSVAAQTALKQAVAVLREFYARQGELIQVSAGRQVPEMEAYTGMRGSKKGVMGMLEVIESDFARVEADTRASETQAAEEHEKFISASEAELKLKRQAEFKLTLKKDQAEFERGQLQKDLDATHEQLHMANLYYEELKPQCVTVHVTYEERASRRQEEIKALQEAYRIIDGKSVRE